jgi:hypothetical protein
VDDIPFTIYLAAYQHYQKNQCHDEDYYKAEVESHEEKFDEVLEEEEEDPPNAANPIPWDELARELPYRGLETEDIEVLDNHPQDLIRNWSNHVGAYPY